MNDRRRWWLHPTSHVSAWGLLLLAMDSGLPHWASTRGQFTKCHKHLRQSGIMCVRMLFISPSIPSPPSLSNQLLLLAGCNLKQGAGHTLGLGSASSTQNSPLQGFLLVCHTAAMLSVCKGCYISVYLCPSGWLETGKVDLWSGACIQPTPLLNFGEWRTKQIDHAASMAKYRSPVTGWFITCE